MNRLLNRRFIPRAVLAAFILAGGLPAAPAEETAIRREIRPLKEEWVLQNGPRQALLLEMYTAQNCPACPMGEAWLEGYSAHELESRGQLWKSVVPVVWHVTYFDRPGLADPLGLYEATMRQQHLVEMLGLGSMYTPSFFNNGAEWRGLQEGTPQPLLPEESSGVMILKNSGKADQGMSVEYTPAEGFDPKAYKGELRGWLVLQVSGVYTDPRRGPDSEEPRASRFAVQAWKGTPVTLKEGKWTGTFDPLPVEAVRQKWPDAHLSIAAWLTADAYAFRPVQAVGSWVK